MVALVVSGSMTLLLSPIFLLLTSGVFGQDCNVIYETKSMCVLKGSSVNMSCTYTYPHGYKLTDTFWIKIPNKKSLKDYPEYKDRVEYIDDRLNKTAVLRLNNVTENDEKEYRFRLITDKDRCSGKPGIKLHVSGLQVQAPPLVLEKETLNLTCRSSCNLSDRFIWYKNGQALTFTSDTLQFQADRSDSGRYSCAVRGHEHLPSPAVSVSVEFVGRQVIYISIGGICGAAVIIIMLLLIWRSRRMNKRHDTMESQMNRSSPRHDRRKACGVELSDPVYENVKMDRKRP